MKVNHYHVNGSAYLFGFVNTGSQVTQATASSLQSVKMNAFGLSSSSSTSFSKLLDTSLIDAHAVPYLDTLVFLGGNGSLPVVPGVINSSVHRGVIQLTNMINAASGPFTLSGESNGAIIVSNVYNLIRYGSLSGRKNDLLGGVTFGNPCRELNHTWPGSSWNGSWDVTNSTTGGHGALPAQYRLQNTETLWWDFVNVGDPLASTADTSSGVNLQILLGLISNYWDGSPLSTFVANNTNIFGSASSVQTIIDSALTGKLAPHIQYGSSTPPLNPQKGLTSYQIAANYLNGLASTYLGGKGSSTSVVPVPLSAATPGRLTSAVQGNNPTASINAAKTILKSTGRSVWTRGLK